MPGADGDQPAPGQVRQVSTPMVLNSTGQLEIFILGTDGQVWSSFANGAGGWNPWQFTSVGVVQQISAMTDASGTVRVFAVGTDKRGNGVKRCWPEDGAVGPLLAAGRSNRSRFQQPSSRPVRPRSSPSVVMAKCGARPMPVTVGPVGTGTSAGVVRNISAAVNDSGLVRLYAVGTDGQIWFESSNGTSGPWNSWGLTEPGAVR